MIKVNVLSEEISWSQKIKKKEELFNNICKRFPKRFRFINRKAYFTLLLSNNRNIKKLNKKFRKKNKETDVLSFPYKSHLNKSYRGDIAICYEIINTRSKNTNFRIELDKIWIHGLLHLLGYNHIKLKDYKLMLKREKDILKRVN